MMTIFLPLLTFFFGGGSGRAGETNGAGVTSAIEAVLRNASRKICDHGPWIVRGASITRSLSRARGFFQRIIWCKAPGPVKFPAAA